MNYDHFREAKTTYEDELRTYLEDSYIERTIQLSQVRNNDYAKSLIHKRIKEIAGKLRELGEVEP